MNARPYRRGGPPRPPAIEQHAEWVNLLRPDGPFIALSVLAETMEQGLETVPRETTDRLRQAWLEVQAAPDLLRAAWVDLVFTELLRWPAGVLADGAQLPNELRSWGGGQARPDAVVYGPDPVHGRAERLLIYRRPWDQPLTKATRDQPSVLDQADQMCRARGVPFALLTNGRFWALVHAKQSGPTSTAIFDADLWLEERDLLRAFATLLGASRLLPPGVQADGTPSTSLAGLFERTAGAQTQITDTLGGQVRQAVELLVSEFARLDRESRGALLADVAERDIYRATLTVMMRLVFLLYAEEQRLLPVLDPVYKDSYAVTTLYDQLDEAHSLHGDEIADTRPAAWPRLLALFSAIYTGCDHPDLRIPAYGGSLFNPARHHWLPTLKVTDRVVHRILDALLFLKQRGKASERLSYKGLDVEQIGHVYEGLLEFSCRKVTEPHLGLIGKLEPELSLTEVEAEYAKGEASFTAWLKKVCDASPSELRKALEFTPDTDDLGDLGSACDNDAELATRTRPFLGLLRRDLRGIPTVFPKGSVLFTQVGDRRATGTHYTPRPLAEEVVEHTLAPLVYEPGPVEGAEPHAWYAKDWEQLLKIKVLDPAMGSGAFLVSACRYLTERVLQAWDRDGLPAQVERALGADFDRDTVRLYALRLVAARCIYGVDRDDMAVELAKLSLWLVTLAKDKPFGFLDHALRCGDSLVGLASESQVAAFHMDPERGKILNNRLSGEIDKVASTILTEVAELRERIEATVVNDVRDAEEKERLLKRADALAERLRLAADAVAGAALSTAGKGDDAFDLRLTSIADEVMAALGGDEAMREEARTTINSWLRGESRPEPIHPLHWALEFPEVMRRGGFDAIVGNPPFMGGSFIRGNIGPDFREYLKAHIAGGQAGVADLCTYFLLRNSSLSNRGRIGIIATNSIAENQAQRVGIRQISQHGWDIYRADKSRKWPGTAAIQVSILWIGRKGSAELTLLDGRSVSKIKDSLDAEGRISGEARPLYSTSPNASNGSKIYGAGFLLDSREARALIAESEKNAQVIYPYLGGDDLTSSPGQAASRFVINFHDWDFEHAARYVGPMAIIEREVKPYREELSANNPARKRWWQYERARNDLYREMKSLRRVMAISRVAKFPYALFVETGQVYSDRLVLFPVDDLGLYALVNGEIHQLWALVEGSKHETRPTYNVAKCFNTFPQPVITERVKEAGDLLHSLRSDIMTRRWIGLTDLYNLVNDSRVQELEVQQIRELHVEIDQAVREAYALDEEREPAIREFEAQKANTPLPTWSEIDLDHGFHDHGQGPRWTIGPQARLDVLDKLLALNFYRYEEEERAGLHSGKRSAKGRRISSAKRPSLPASGASLNEESVDDGLFPRPDALF